MAYSEPIEFEPLWSKKMLELNWTQPIRGKTEVRGIAYGLRCMAPTLKFKELYRQMPITECAMD